MKNTILLFSVILLCQLLVPVFYIQLIIYLTFGFVFSFKIQIKRLFLKVFFLEALICAGFVLFYADQIAVFKDTISYLGIPLDYSGLVLKALIILINSLTVAFAFQIGNSIHKLIK